MFRPASELITTIVRVLGECPEKWRLSKDGNALAIGMGIDVELVNHGDAWRVRRPGYLETNRESKLLNSAVEHWLSEKIQDKLPSEEQRRHEKRILEGLRNGTLFVSRRPAMPEPDPEETEEGTFFDSY